MTDTGETKAGPLIPPNIEHGSGDKPFPVFAFRHEASNGGQFITGAQVQGQRYGCA